MSKYLASSSFVISVTLGIVLLQAVSSNGRVAIIGSGIGGSSAAHYLRRLRPDVDIVVYEKLPVVGGRMTTVDVAGQAFEAAAAILHPRNQYMKNFTELLHLARKVDEVESVGIFDGRTYHGVKSGDSWAATASDALAALRRWGADLWRLEVAVGRLLDDFDSIYALQDAGRAFGDVDALLDAASGDGEFRHMRRSDGEWFARRVWRLSSDTVRLLLGAFAHVNYNQDASRLNAFVLAVSLAGVQDGLWAVAGGNGRVCSGLLAAAEVDLRHDAVSSVRRRGGGGSSIEYTVTTVSGETDTFDAVVLASPLQTSRIELVDFATPPTRAAMGSYQRTMVTFVVGQPSKAYFGLDTDNPDPFPALVISASDDSAPISVIGIPGSSVTGEPAHNRSLWKMFSKLPLSSDTLDQLFVQRESVTVREFAAFPDYGTTPDELPGFVLDHGVFYTSPIEWAASAMEMSAVSGRNAAILADSVLPHRCSLTASAGGECRSSSGAAAEGADRYTTGG